MVKKPENKPAGKTPEPDKTKNLPATKPAPGAVAIPDHLKGALAASTGRGISTSRDDTIIPMAHVFQKGHTQTDERDESYVEGAKPGEIWLKGSVVPVRSGVKGELFQPVAFMKVWIEWKPKRAGFAGRHDKRPEDAYEGLIQNDAGEERPAWLRPNGNVLVETREHYGFFGDEPYMIPMTSTQHTVSRTWMSLMGQFKDERGKPLDSFAKVYLLTTTRREKDGNSWYVFKVDDAGWATLAQYERGASFFDSIMSGEKRAADYEETATGPDHDEPDNGAGDSGI